MVWTEGTHVFNTVKVIHIPTLVVLPPCATFHLRKNTAVSHIFVFHVVRFQESWVTRSPRGSSSPPAAPF